MKTIIISDLHLGSDVCQAKEIYDFLDNIECDRLILNGDVFDSMDFRRLKKSHWHILSKLRKMSDKIEVIWVAGNHDGSAEIVSHLLGITVVDECQFDSNNKKILVLHGHIFDKFITKNPIVTGLADFAYRILQKIDKSHYIARQAKYNSKIFLRCSENIKNSAKEYASEIGCHIVCCGHTHHAEAESCGEVLYFNSGCWTEKICNFIEIVNGKISLLEFKKTE